MYSIKVAVRLFGIWPQPLPRLANHWSNISFKICQSWFQKTIQQKLGPWHLGNMFLKLCI